MHIGSGRRTGNQTCLIDILISNTHLNKNDYEETNDQKFIARNGVMPYGNECGRTAGPQLREESDQEPRKCV